MMRWSDMRQEASVVVNVDTRDALLSDLEARLRASEGFSVATLNLDHVTKLRRLPAFRAAYQRQTHVTADGNPIVWFSRIAGHHVSLVPGSELVEPLAALAARCGVPVALLGSTEPSLAAAAQALRAAYPDLQIVAQIAPQMGFDPTGPEAQDHVKALAASGAGLCFLALGAPKQEIFAAHASEQLPQAGFVSIGAGLDFLSGQQVRAPKLVRALAAEWLWRLALNPSRLARRYGACIAILPSLLQRALKIRFAGGQNSA